MEKDEADLLLRVLDRPIAFHRSFVPICGENVAAALLLSQLLYWQRRSKDPGGWVYKTRAEWEQETGLKRSGQETARRKLREAGFWEEDQRAGLQRTMHYRVNVSRLLFALRVTAAGDGDGPEERPKRRPTSGGKPAAVPMDSRNESETTAERLEGEGLALEAERLYVEHSTALFVFFRTLPTVTQKRELVARFEFHLQQGHAITREAVAEAVARGRRWCKEKGSSPTVGVLGRALADVLNPDTEGEDGRDDEWELWARDR